MDMKKVVEYHSAGKEVWSFAVESPWSAVGLKNGNTLIATNKKVVEEIRPKGNVQALEVTAAKKLVWTLRSWTDPLNLGAATIIQLLDPSSPPEDVHFGDIR